MDAQEALRQACILLRDWRALPASARAHRWRELRERTGTFLRAHMPEYAEPPLMPGSGFHNPHAAPDAGAPIREKLKKREKPSRGPPPPGRRRED